MTTQIPSSIALLDYSHIVRSNFARVGPDETGSLTLKTLAAARSSSAHVVICLDSKPYWRSQKFEGYKAGRKIEPELVNIWERTLERVKAEGYNIAKAPNEESDDVMSTLARIYSLVYGCMDVRLVTQDKDILQCLTDRVRQFYPVMGKADEFEIRGPEFPETSKDFGFSEKTEKKEGTRGVKVADVALLQAIMGDTSDKIPGIAGIGPITGARLINTYGTPGDHMKTMAAIATACVGAVDAAKMSSGKLAAMWASYAAGMHLLPKWLELTTLRTNVALELHPLKYLERIAPAMLVAEDEVGDAFEGELVEEVTADEEVEWDRIAEETRQREAQELARAMNTADVISQPKPIIGAAPDAAETLKAAAAERAEHTPELQKRIDKELARDKAEYLADVAAGVKGLTPRRDVTPEELAAATAPKAPVSGSAAKSSASPAPSAKSSDASAAPVSPSTADPKAPAPAAGAPAPAAGSAPTQDTAASVVPNTQGPAKGAAPRKQDDIDSVALAVRPEAPSWALQLQPATAKEALQIATTLYNSAMFRAFGSERGNFAIISYGRELGLGFMQSLMGFYDVNGRPFCGAHTIRGLVLAHPTCEYLICTESTDQSSTWITRRKGWPTGREVTYTFTYAEADRIGLTTGKNRHNWENNPRAMVDKTASSRLCRQVYADVIGGLHSIEESE